MAQTLDLELLCLRHGKTKYTGVFPDLTPEGIEQVRDTTANFVLPWVNERKSTHPLTIVSSPAPRAHGTASVIADMLGHTKPIALEPELGPMRWRDEERALAACRGFIGKGYIDYEKEPVFADASIFETPDEVRERWNDFFSSFVRTSAETAPSSVILVSHYEILSNITRDFFGVVATEQTSLQYVEPIHLSFSVRGSRRALMMHGKFRGQKVSRIMI